MKNIIIKIRKPIDRLNTNYWPLAKKREFMKENIEF
jgi:hypothetical protein